MIENQVRMAWECCRMVLKVMLVLENLSNVLFWTSKLIFESFQCIFWTSMSILDTPTAYYWTSMPIRNCRNSLRGWVGGAARPRGGDGGGAATAAAAATTVSQELWTSGGALFQRARGPNIPFGESLTSIVCTAEAPCQ